VSGRWCCAERTNDGRAGGVLARHQPGCCSETKRPGGNPVFQYIGAHSAERNLLAAVDRVWTHSQAGRMSWRALSAELLREPFVRRCWRSASAIRTLSESRPIGTAALESRRDRGGVGARGDLGRRAACGVLASQLRQTRSRPPSGSGSDLLAIDQRADLVVAVDRHRRIPSKLRVKRCSDLSSLREAKGDQLPGPLLVSQERADVTVTEPAACAHVRSARSTSMGAVEL
jgi:hypothetical protein